MDLRDRFDRPIDGATPEGLCRFFQLHSLELIKFQTKMLNLRFNLKFKPKINSFRLQIGT